MAEALKLASKRDPSKDAKRALQNLYVPTALGFLHDVVLNDAVPMRERVLAAICLSTKAAVPEYEEIEED